MTRTTLTLSFLTTLALAISLASPALAQKEAVLYNFQGAGDGSLPNDGLIADAAGHFYGTTQGLPYGSVFELVHLSSGWTINTIHTFSGADGSFPQGGLLMDSHGDLYGTTSSRGNYDDGVVFKLIHTSAGWSNEVVLYNFHYDGVTFFDGRSPLSNLIQDKNGHLFGTTQFGGTGRPCACGTVFELVPHPGGVWSERILYNFQGSTDGLPVAGLIFDHAGNLYGTTLNGGDGASAISIPVAAPCFLFRPTAPADGPSPCSTPSRDSPTVHFQPPDSLSIPPAICTGLRRERARTSRIPPSSSYLRLPAAGSNPPSTAFPTTKATATHLWVES